MEITIENEQTVKVVKQLAESLGVSFTTAIEIAATAALRSPSQSAEERTLQQVDQIVADYQAHLPATHNIDTKALYDADGLFR